MNDWVKEANLKGPKGDKGDTGAVGPPNVLTVGTVETVLPTEPAVVEITGTSPAQVINFEIPQGVPGPGAAGINLGTGVPVFAGADPGTGIMEFWQLRAAGLTTIVLDAVGVLITTLVGWADISGKPATFPPTLPIPSSGVTGLDTKQASQDAAIGTKLDASAYTAADVLTKIKTVDGAGSGLDADLLDGQNSTAFALATALALTPVVPNITAVDAAIDWDLLTTPGFANAILGTTNPHHPASGKYFYCLTLQYSVNGNTTQVAIPFGQTADIAAGIWWRGRTGGTWTAWQTFALAGSAQAAVGAAAPGSPGTGQLWWNSTTKTLSVWTGTWEPVQATWGA